MILILKHQTLFCVYSVCLADIYPLKRTDNVMAEEKFEMKNNSEDTIKLYDVVYACVPLGEENG